MASQTKRYDAGVAVLKQVGGRDYDATFGKRQTGTGVYAQLIRKRFEIACKRFRLNEDL